MASPALTHLTSQNKFKNDVRLHVLQPVKPVQQLLRHHEARPS